MLENIEHLLARYPFVPFQEIIHCGARFKMFKKNAHRQSGTFKYPGAARALRDAFDRGTR